MMHEFRQVFVLFFSVVFISDAALATSLIQPPNYVTVGLLKSFCESDEKQQDRLNVYGLGYCEGYLRGITEAYFQKYTAKRSRSKLNGCLLMFGMSYKLITDDIRKELLMISDGSILSQFHGPSAEGWIKARLVEKCEPKK
jgi:hypothetical protein